VFKQILVSSLVVETILLGRYFSRNFADQYWARDLLQNFNRNFTTSPARAGQHFHPRKFMTTHFQGNFRLPCQGDSRSVRVGALAGTM
jgi:hypothetical protein